MRRHLRNSLIRNSYLLIGLQITTTLASLGFWGIASRTLSPEDVGVASSTVTSATLLASLAHLGIDLGLVKHLPQTSTPSRLLNFSFFFIFVMSTGLATIFLSGLPVWSPGLLIVTTHKVTIVIFVMLTFSMSLSLLLHRIFLTKKHIEFSLYEFGLNGILRMILLLVSLPFLPGFISVLLAYLLGFLIATPMSLFLFLPKAQPNYHISFDLWPIPRGAFFKDSLGNFLSVQFQRLSDWLLPLIILNVAGASSAAFFYIPWSMRSSLYGWTGSISMSLFAEGSNDPDRTQQYTRQAILLGIGLAGLIATPGILGARLFLALFGSDYATNGSKPFQVLIISLLPGTIIYVYTGLLRASSKIRKLILVTGINALLSIGLSVILLRQYQLVGASLGWLIAQILTLTIVLPDLVPVISKDIPEFRNLIARGK